MSIAREGARPRRVGSVLAGLGSFAVFVAMTIALLADHRAPFPVDQAMHAWALRHRSPVLTAVALVITASGSGLPAYVIAAAAGWLAHTRDTGRRLRGAAVALAGLLLGQGVRLGIADLVGRPRPPRDDWAGSAGGAAYPSGHTTTSALVAALVCAAAARRLSGRPRHTAWCAAITWAVLVGLTRIYLGVHWPTDVLGGWLLAAALVAGAACLVDIAAARTSAGRRR